MDPVRKVYLGAGASGESTEYWENEWSQTDIPGEVERHITEPSTLMSLLNAWVPAQGLIVEIGSGTSTHLAALASPRRTLIGLDLAQQAMVRSSREIPDLRGLLADMHRVPLRSGSVDCVISLGVVEHTESGPTEALREHVRILRPGGLALISVPVINVVRRIKDGWHLGALRKPFYMSRGRVVSRTRALQVQDRAGFHQYEFTEKDWSHRIDAVGLEVLSSHRYLVSAGVGELGFVTRLARQEQPALRAHEDPWAADGHRRASRSPDLSANGLKQRASRVLIRERPNGWAEAQLTALAQIMLGHMVLVVAQRPL